MWIKVPDEYDRPITINTDNIAYIVPSGKPDECFVYFNSHASAGHRSGDRAANGLARLQLSISTHSLEILLTGSKLTKLILLGVSDVD